MEARGEGVARRARADADAGTRYAFRVHDDLLVPDPASRFNPGGGVQRAVAGGRSRVVRMARRPRCGAGRGKRPWVYRAPCRHFSRRTAHIRRRDGADRRPCRARRDGHRDHAGWRRFPGSRNWGYDGRAGRTRSWPIAYWHAGRLQAARPTRRTRRGVIVLLDVVYNHFGPEATTCTPTRRSSSIHGTRPPLGRGDLKLRRRP